MLNINFKEQEKIDFLEQRGYKVIDFGVWVSINGYHGDVTFEDRIIKVAYKEGYPSILDECAEDNEKYRVENKIGLNTIFEKELKHKLLFE
jgi:hypothetical protein